MTDPQKPFKIKLHPLMDEKTLNSISDATLAAIDDQLYKPPALTPDDIGKDIKGEGIYLGTYAPVDRDGVSLKKVFNVFAAPEDLPETMKYVDTVEHIAKLKKWHGYDGTNYATDKELYTAIKNGSYKGGWIIPPSDILQGKDVDGKDTTPDNIITHQDTGSFKDTFRMAVSSGSDYPGGYWSSTEHRVNPSGVLDVLLSDGNGGWDLKDYYRLSCRPVRLAPVKN